MARSRIRPVRGYPKYFVSDHGEVYSEHYGYRRLLKPWLFFGYLKVSLVRKAGGRKHWYVHQLVINTFGRRRPSRRHESCHKDGNPLNCHYKNLKWGTHTDNMRDMVRHGRGWLGKKRPEMSGNKHPLRKHPERAPHGERSALAKLTPGQVRAIRAAPTGYGTAVKLAAKYGVHWKTISKIRKRKSWRYT